MTSFFIVEIDEVFFSSHRGYKKNDGISAKEDEIVQLKTRGNSLKMQMKSKSEEYWLVSQRRRRECMHVPFFGKVAARDFGDGSIQHIERAHRIPSSSQGRRRQDGKVPPRTIVMKFLNFKLKEQVLKAARLKGSIIYKDHNFIFSLMYQLRSTENRGATMQFEKDDLKRE